MPKLRIGVLYDFWWDEDEERAGEGARPKRKAPDEDVQEVYESLKKAGHNPIFLRLDGTVQSLIELAQTETDLIFNLVESFGGNDTLDSNVAAYLELLGRKFTGAGSHGLYLAQDKALAKKIFAFHGIHTPYFATVYRGRTEHAHDIQFPVIVKPAREDGSIGIHFGAVCGSIKELMERLDYIHAQFDSPALIEEYIEGRELYVGVLGNDKPEPLPVVELDLSKLPEGTPKIAGSEVKWEEETEAYQKTWPFFPKDLDEELVTKIREKAVQAFQSLQLRDYGRIDFRLASDGTLHVLEVNPNPYLLPSAELALAAKQSGRSFSDLIAQIVELALARYNGGS
ncbi:MAG: ATP-grasp domain-containing protein [Candidatus Eisenbacteria bacterium]|uniref:ATP-grasp domain-containing protein n=1 Tax=Eiseniibacteriota bacterium TaxID=2212470 RepID=A0A538SLK6_UNCEI|nr:MAG: ATP-grasp domain-containing protein [Candidatus Eisenbacteria bacterium]